MNKCTFLSFAAALMCVPLLSNAQLGVNSGWNWIKGFNSPVHAGIFSAQTISSPTNKPSSRIDETFTKDAAGNFWIYGGYGQGTLYAGVLGDLWKFDPLTEEWSWFNSDSSLNTPVTVTAQGVFDPSNKPGCRVNAAMWPDAAGNLWIFGGGTLGGNKADMWRFDVSLNQWAWISGDPGFHSTGNYGTLGNPSVANLPPARRKAATWTDAAGNFWLFGGESNDAGFINTFHHNDLWKYNPGTSEWTWIKGSNMADQPGNHGTQGTANAANTPGARRSPVYWTDHSGNFWLYGGYGRDAQGNLGYLNDLWKYTPGNNQWTWMKGNKLHGIAAVYGTQGVAAGANKPPAHEAGFGWKDTSGNLWLYGGEGADLYNSLWKFETATNKWAWMKGDATPDLTPSHGTQNIPDYSNTPGGRASGASWTDNEGRFWLFGGKATNPSYPNGADHDDVWRLDCLPPAQPLEIYGPLSVCIGDTATYSVAPIPGAISYSWTLSSGWSGFSTTNSITVTSGNTPGMITVEVNGDCDTSLPQSINVTLHPSGTPAATMSITQGSNPGCLDSLIEFTATSTNTVNPFYTWYVNGTAIATGPIYSSSSFQSGDVVYVIVSEADSVCLSEGTGTSNSETLALYATPQAPLISFIGNLLVSTLPNVQWYGPAGLIPGATGQTYHPIEDGLYYAVQTTTGCNSAPSNLLMVSMLSVEAYEMNQVTIYPNPAQGHLTLDWGTAPQVISVELYHPSGRLMKKETVRNSSMYRMDLANITNGVYILVLKDNQRRTGATRIIVVR